MSDNPRDDAFNAGLSAYCGEPCRVCGKMLGPEDMGPGGAVFAGYGIRGGVVSRAAHGDCWRNRPAMREWAYPDEMQNPAHAAFIADLADLMRKHGATVVDVYNDARDTYHETFKVGGEHVADLVARLEPLGLTEDEPGREWQESDGEPVAVPKHEGTVVAFTRDVLLADGFVSGPSPPR